jgi:hypothetical protein
VCYCWKVDLGAPAASTTLKHGATAGSPGRSTSKCFEYLLDICVSHSRILEEGLKAFGAVTQMPVPVGWVRASRRLLWRRDGAAVSPASDCSRRRRTPPHVNSEATGSARSPCTRTTSKSREPRQNQGVFGLRSHRRTSQLSSGPWIQRCG